MQISTLASLILWLLLLAVDGMPLIAPGRFDLAGNSGVPAMHAALMPDGKVIFLDKLENYTELTLPNGRYAYSSQYDPFTKELTPISIASNAFCCGGSFLSDGRLLTVGGNGRMPWIDPTIQDGFGSVRVLAAGRATWEEYESELASRRWYASVQALADGSNFVASGSLNGMDPTKHENNNPTYELLDREGRSNGKNVPLDILVKNQPYFMYPFLHLLKDGTLFIFVSRSSQIYDVMKDKVDRELPDLKGMHRTYPTTGGSVMLPLDPEKEYQPDIMICGGGAYQDISSPTDPTCGIISPLSPKPKWKMTTMPQPRTMVEGINLLDGTILWLNGASTGAEGFGIAADPALGALIYDPKKDSWYKAGASNIARLYHSVALMLLDGTILVAGSNPNEMPVLLNDVIANVPSRAYPTDFRVEIYTPPYLMGTNAYNRPKGVWLSSDALRADGRMIQMTFTTVTQPQDVKVVLYHGGFVTHALHMGQRMVYLSHGKIEPTDTGELRRMDVVLPTDSGVLPSGPYLLFVVVDGVPSIGRPIMIMA